MQTISKGGIQWQTMIFFFFNLERNPDAEVFLSLHISPQNGRVCDTVLLGATFGKWLHFYPHSFTAGLEARPFWRPLVRWQEAHGRSVCHEDAPLISCFQDKNTNTLGQNVLRTGAWMAWLWKALVILKQLHSNKRNLECQKSDHFTQHFLRQSFNSFFFLTDSWLWRHVRQQTLKAGFYDAEATTRSQKLERNISHFLRTHS